MPSKVGDEKRVSLRLSSPENKKSTFLLCKIFNLTLVLGNLITMHLAMGSFRFCLFGFNEQQLSVCLHLSPNLEDLQ